MRILMIHNSPLFPGGEDVYFNSLIDLLKEKGNKVIIYTKQSRSIRTIQNKISTSLGLFWNKKVEEELTQIIRQSKPEIAHFHNIYPLIGQTAYWVCKRFKIPIVQRMSSFRFICPKGILFREGKICEQCVAKNFFYPAILFKCYQKSYLGSMVFSISHFYHSIIKSREHIDRYIFQAKYVKDYFLKYMNISSEKTAIISHFVPNYNLLCLNKEDYFVYAGRLSEEKGIIPLLNIFSSFPKIKLVVIGDGPLKNQVESFSRYKNIQIKGFLSEKETLRIISKAKFTIIPSLFYETGPLVLMESFSVGTPVIVPRFGIFKDEIKDGQTGFFYKHADFNDLKKLLIYLSKQNSHTKRMNKLAYLEYLNKYSGKIHYDKLMRVYLELRRTR